MTVNGGQYCDYLGTIFKLSPDGTLTNLVLLNRANGAEPQAALLNLVSPAAWTTVSPEPVVLNGQNTVTNPTSGTQQFYRLAQ